MILEEYSQSLLIEKHASKATREVYSRELACFLSYIQDNSLDYAAITTSELKDYLLWRANGGGSEQKLSPRTLSRTVTVLKSFFSYLQNERIRSDDPTELLPRNKTPKRLPQTIDTDAVSRILEVIDTASDIGFRDRTMFELIYSCGLRVSECSQLKVQKMVLIANIAKQTTPEYLIEQSIMQNIIFTQISSETSSLIASK